MNGLFVHWSRGWGVLLFSERLVHYVPLIVSLWNFHELLPLTKVMSMQKDKVRGQRSGSQRSKQILPQFGRFGTVTPVFIKNVIAVAAYSRLGSWSQAKFQTMKLSPLSAPRAAAPAQSTISTCRSLRFSPRLCADVSLNTHCPSGLPRQIRASKRR